MVKNKDTPKPHTNMLSVFLRVFEGYEGWGYEGFEWFEGFKGFEIFWGFFEKFEKFWKVLNFVSMVTVVTWFWCVTILHHFPRNHMINIKLKLLGKFKMVY